MPKRAQKPIEFLDHYGQVRTLETCAGCGVRFQVDPDWPDCPRCRQADDLITDRTYRLIDQVAA